MAINIPYIAIERAVLIVWGRNILAPAPVRVPVDQPKIGNIIRPKKYLNDTFSSLWHITAKTSSVIPNEHISLWEKVIFFSTFWDMAKDIRKYLKFIIKVVTASSISVPPAIIISSPANCPALVKLVRDIKTDVNIDKPPWVASNPKAKDTDMYASAIGTPSFNPIKNLFFN